MEWAESDVVGSASLERNEVADHVDDVGGVKDFLDCFAVDSSHSGRV